MNVFLVERNDYSDREVFAVATSLEAAKRRVRDDIQRMIDKNPAHGWPLPYTDNFEERLPHVEDPRPSWYDPSDIIRTYEYRGGGDFYIYEFPLADDHDDPRA